MVPYRELNRQRRRSLRHYRTDWIHKITSTAEHDRVSSLDSIIGELVKAALGRIASHLHSVLTEDMLRRTSSCGLVCPIIAP